jgi:hypothetical protein
MGHGGRELGRVEHDRVEGAARLAEAAQAGVDVGIEELGAACIEAVERDVGARPLQRRAPTNRSRSLRRRRRPSPPR